MRSSTLLAFAVLAACGDDVPAPDVNLQAFSLRFSPFYGDTPLTCGQAVTGLGASGMVRIEPSDLRFYISKLEFLGEDGGVVASELDTNEFQYRDATGEVALVDLTDASAGACAGTGLTFPEGTARTHAAVTGRTVVADVHAVRFEVGLPQPLMKTVLARHTAEDAPSPLNEMHWSWAYAYRHFVFNFSLADDGVAGEGYVHVGSVDCGGDGVRALTDRATCGKVNAAKVELQEFHLPNASVGVDVGALLDGLDLRVAQTATSAVMVPGVACHSSPEQPHCAPLFSKLGLDMSDGTARASNNVVFKAR